MKKSTEAGWWRGAAWVGGLIMTVALSAAERPIPKPYGPYIHPTEADFQDAVSFGKDQRIVGTYYFYWYDNSTKSHVVDGDGTDALTTHPPTLEGFSYKSVAWHRRQLEDMMAAGLDFLLPVFWGAPSEQRKGAGLHWSYEGLPPLVEAREQLVAEGKKPPRIGLFYDTSTLRHNAWGYHADLTTDYGRRWFAATVVDFFSMVPPKHWAMIEGRPIVLLYSASFAEKHGQSVIDFTKQEFARMFAGREPWIGREVSWQVEADGTVAWGGALGLRTPGIASVGPGYDHSAVPGRRPLIVDRQGGKFYEENWIKLLRRPATMVMVETWNEFHEGTDVAESKEYGRQYIELTRKYADLFRQGYVPPWPKGSYHGAGSVGITLGRENKERGLTQVENEDGVTTVVERGGREGRMIDVRAGLGHYIYFKVDDSFKDPKPSDYTLEVEYFDGGKGQLTVEFDGSDRRAPFQGAYSPAGKTVELRGDKQWKKAMFPLRKARFLNGQNRGADLRLVLVGADGLAVSSVELRRSETSR